MIKRNKRILSLFIALQIILTSLPYKVKADEGLFSTDYPKVKVVNNVKATVEKIKTIYPMEVRPANNFKSPLEKYKGDLTEETLADVIRYDGFTKGEPIIGNGRNLKRNIMEALHYLESKDIISADVGISYNGTLSVVTSPTRYNSYDGNNMQQVRKSDFIMALMKAVDGVVYSRPIVTQSGTSRMTSECSVSEFRKAVTNNMETLMNDYSTFGVKQIYKSPNIPELYYTKALDMGILQLREFNPNSKYYEIYTKKKLPMYSADLGEYRYGHNSAVMSFNQDESKVARLKQLGKWRDDYAIGGFHYPATNKTGEGNVFGEYYTPIPTGCTNHTKFVSTYNINERVLKDKYLKFSDAVKIVAKAMNLYGESGMTKTEQNLILSAYGVALGNLPNDLKEALSYLIAKGVINPETFDWTSVYRMCTEEDAVQMVYRIAKKDARYVFKQINMVADVDLLRKEYYKSNIKVNYLAQDIPKIDIKDNKDRQAKNSNLSDIYIKSDGNFYNNIHDYDFYMDNVKYIPTIDKIRIGNTKWIKVTLPEDVINNGVQMVDGVGNTIYGIHGTGIYLYNGSDTLDYIGYNMKVDDESVTDLLQELRHEEVIRPERYQANKASITVSLVADCKNLYRYESVPLFDGDNINSKVVTAFQKGNHNGTVKSSQSGKFINIVFESEFLDNKSIANIVYNKLSIVGSKAKSVNVDGYTQIRNGNVINLISERELKKFNITVKADKKNTGRILENTVTKRKAFIPDTGTQAFIGNEIKKYAEGTILIQQAKTDNVQRYYNLDVVSSLMKLSSKDERVNGNDVLVSYATNTVFNETPLSIYTDNYEGNKDRRKYDAGKAYTTSMNSNNYVDLNTIGSRADNFIIEKGANDGNLFKSLLAFVPTSLTSEIDKPSSPNLCDVIKGMRTKDFSCMDSTYKLACIENTVINNTIAKAMLGMNDVDSTVISEMCQVPRVVLFVDVPNGANQDTIYKLEKEAYIKFLNKCKDSFCENTRYIIDDTEVTGLTLSDLNGKFKLGIPVLHKGDIPTWLNSKFIIDKDVRSRMDKAYQNVGKPLDKRQLFFVPVTKTGKGEGRTSTNSCFAVANNGNILAKVTGSIADDTSINRYLGANYYMSDNKLSAIYSQKYEGIPDGYMPLDRLQDCNDTDNKPITINLNGQAFTVLNTASLGQYDMTNKNKTIIGIKLIAHQYMCVAEDTFENIKKLKTDNKLAKDFVKTSEKWLAERYRPYCLNSKIATQATNGANLSMLPSKYELRAWGGLTSDNLMKGVPNRPNPILYYSDGRAIDGCNYKNYTTFAMIHNNIVGDKPLLPKSSKASLISSPVVLMSYGSIIVNKQNKTAYRHNTGKSYVRGIEPVHDLVTNIVNIIKSKSQDVVYLKDIPEGGLMTVGGEFAVRVGKEGSTRKNTTFIPTIFLNTDTITSVDRLETCLVKVAKSLSKVTVNSDTESSPLLQLAYIPSILPPTLSELQVFCKQASTVASHKFPQAPKTPLGSKCYYTEGLNQSNFKLGVASISNSGGVTATKGSPDRIFPRVDLYPMMKFIKRKVDTVDVYECVGYDDMNGLNLSKFTDYALSVSTDGNSQENYMCLWEDFLKMDIDFINTHNTPFKDAKYKLNSFMNLITNMTKSMSDFVAGLPALACFTCLCYFIILFVVVMLTHIHLCRLFMSMKYCNLIKYVSLGKIPNAYEVDYKEVYLRIFISVMVILLVANLAVLKFALAFKNIIDIFFDILEQSFRSILT